MDYCEAIQRFCDDVESRLEKEIRLGDPFDLDEAIGGTYISKFHFYRIFKAITGLSVLDYVKRRRLGLAAGHLLESRDDILTTAVKFGFHSPEVFIRNFKKQFGRTPSSFRKTGTIDEIRGNAGKIHVVALRFAVKNRNGTIHVAEHTETIRDLKLVGYERVTRNGESRTVIDAMDRFLRAMHRIPNARTDAVYRLCYDLNNDGGNESYKELIAVAVDDFDAIPAGMACKHIRDTRIVTYRHEGKLFTEHTENIVRTYEFLYGYRIPHSGVILTADFTMERYPATFAGPYEDGAVVDISFSIQPQNEQ
jgi:AraC family transcriptional regulator